ncbi:MAG: carotenoid biosynthesis protein [Bacteroidetes bacterium]|nr:carotenoid biosynthesis protein [Bacteroidota bacterium]
MNWTDSQRWISLLMLILNGVGLAGILLGFGERILQFTALNLLISGLLAMAFDWDSRSRLWWLAAIGGWLAECIGVQTGLLFGQYNYSEGLGPKLAGVPLILGILWFVMLMGFGHWTSTWVERFHWSQRTRKIATAFLAATLMMALDAFIEPVAIQAGWWSWSNIDVPWTNYASWWALAFLFHLVPKTSPQSKGAGILVLIFATFFILLNTFQWTA